MSRGLIGPKTRAFLTGILDSFGHLGRPTEIVVCRPIGEIETLDLIMQPTANDGRLVSEQLAHRRRLFRNLGGGAQRSKANGTR
jgi:hypothetical protein